MNKKIKLSYFVLLSLFFILTGCTLPTISPYVPAELSEICGNQNCTGLENHYYCAPDCKSKIQAPEVNLSNGEKAIYLNFIYKNKEYELYFVADKNSSDYFASLSRTIMYNPNKEPVPNRGNYSINVIKNELQKQKLMPLVSWLKNQSDSRQTQARLAIAMVQSIRYDTQGAKSENPVQKYPYEVLYNEKGVCSEKTDLLLFLLKEIGFSTGIIVFPEQNHVTVGISCPENYVYKNTNLCFVETTAPSLITDSEQNYSTVGKLTGNFSTYNISGGISLDHLEEEISDLSQLRVYNEKSAANNGTLEMDDYLLYVKLLRKYGM